MSENGRLKKLVTAVAAALLALLALRPSNASSKSRAGKRFAPQRNIGTEDHRARGEHAPAELRAPAWPDFIWRMYGAVSRDRLLLVAAGITFYGLLALFPALTALVSIAGFFVDPDRVMGQLQSFSHFLPEGSVGLIEGQMRRISSQPTNNLSFAFLAGLSFSLWSANNGIKAIFDGLNVAYDEREERGFVRLSLVSLLFTLGAIGTIVLALGAIVVVPTVLGYVGLEGTAATVIGLARWPILFALIVLGIGLLYRFGPSRSPARWRWLSAGSLLAALLWVAASAAFSWYVSNFSTYNETYGSLGAVIAFMVWMWISATIVLLGAELNSELERQGASAH
jgi:membrane protein